MQHLFAFKSKMQNLLSESIKKTSGFLDAEKRFHYASRKGLAPLIYIAFGKLFQVINQSR